MKVIILASGRGIRFLPLSETIPKPLITFLGKSILEHNLENLVGITDEVFIVIGYLGDKIKERLGDSYKGIKINYILDNDIAGTGASAKLAIKNISDEKVFVMNGDDIYSREDIEKMIDKFPCILLKKVENPSLFGVVEVNDEVLGIEEKPVNPKSDLANIGLYFIPRNIFDYDIQKSERGEYEITEYIKEYIKENKLNYAEAEFWSPASYPWDLLKTINSMFEKLQFENQGEVEQGVILKGGVFIGKNSIIKSGSYIEGPVYIGSNCRIGPNAYLRPYSVIEDNVSIGASVEIKNSLIGIGSKINHLSYVGDSIIGSNVNLGAGTITTNLRHDEENIKSLVKDDLIDTKLKKLGAIIGDNVKTGSNTIIYPGRKIYSQKFTSPNQEIKEDLI